jgi:ribokinase
VLVCALGDLTLDVVVRLQGPVAGGADTSAAIQLSPGGQAANVAAWAVALGARARYVGKRGADEAGGLAAAALRARGVEVLGPAAGRGGIICSLVEPGGERSMLSDRGVATELARDEVDPAWLADCDHLFVSGYALFREPVRSTAQAAAELARAAGAAVSVDLSSWSGMRESTPESVRKALERLGPDVVFANEDEDRTFGEPLPGATWIVKRGAAGCTFAGVHRSAVPVERVVDTTGAGDALAAGYLVGGPELALEAAARCIQRVGAMPDEIGSPG